MSTGYPFVLCAPSAVLILRETGRLKAAGRISLADAFAVALANLKGGWLITADHHELDPVEVRGDGRFYWIR